MTDRHEDRVRERAYAIWEKEGRPDGEDLRHWSAAEAELRGTNEQAGKQIEETEAATRVTGVPTPPPSLANLD